ncbi:MAG TPA: PHP domain-containing protein [Solirubrobacteraceae bacterium]|nr:PHP domain-containing protein [Solirubrobacteraceae bacterium]
MSDAPTFDLQSHSRHSDGELTPRGVVEAAAAAGVELLALTDHDTVDGVAEAGAAARAAGIRLSPAVEISSLDAAGADLHILGYALDAQDPQLLDALARYRADRERRTEAMIAALRDNGWEVDEAPLRERAAAGKTIGRPHIAQATTSHPANAGRLAREGLDDASSFLGAYLVEGRPGFRPREIPTVEDAIATIHAAGGVAVWAHPFWDVPDPGEVVSTLERFTGWGIDGAECFYLTHTEPQTRVLVEYCAERDLLRTGSSDFHGPHHRLMSSFRDFSLYGFTPELGPIPPSG